MSFRIAMIGAGSPGFSTAVARELIRSQILADSTLVLMDVDQDRLNRSEARIRSLAREQKSSIVIRETTDRREALDGADFVVTSYAPSRLEFWVKDIEIAERHGVKMLTGENGGPAGQIHALRNISIMQEIVRDMMDLCPDAWLMNFTNPMSMLCTYLNRFTKINALGFCHQVHGSFGVVSEMLGMNPGDLQVFSVGINHMNFLLDLRKKGQCGSYMEEFLSKVRESPYWKKNREYVPEQLFTGEFLDAFGIYPVGYDNHISEYISFFYSEKAWAPLDYRRLVEVLKELQDVSDNAPVSGNIDDVEPERMLCQGLFPFPKDPNNAYYRESAVDVMESLVTNKPLYLDAMVIPNHGCVSNLPYDAVVDIPAVIAGGRARGVEVGELPPFAAELCRRQIVIHEMVAQAAETGDKQRLLEAFCLDPYVHDLRAAKAMMEDYLQEYREFLPRFFSAAAVYRNNTPRRVYEPAQTGASTGSVRHAS